LVKNKQLEPVGVSSEAIENGPKYHNKWSNTAEEVYKYIHIMGIKMATAKEAISMR
jgi:hypothetical protein